MNNEVRLIGNIGQLPGIHTTESGVKIQKLSLATNDKYTNKKGEKVSKAVWHNVIIFGKLAEIVSKYCSIGSKVAINGRLTYRVYQDKDSVDRYVTEINASDVLFLDNKKDQAAD